MKVLLIITASILSFNLPITSALAFFEYENREPERAVIKEERMLAAKLIETIKNGTPALPGQGEMNKSQEDVMSNELIRPEGQKYSEGQGKIGVPTKTVDMTVTAYCNVPKTAKNRKKAKLNGTGVTSGGHKAIVGTISADQRFYPKGTILCVPGYGKGTVDDCGGGIKGKNHIDIFMASYEEAMKWGKPMVKVQVLKLARKK